MYSSIDVENEYFVHKYDGPVIAYYDAMNCDLKSAVWHNMGVWVIETVDSTGDVGKYCSLTLNYYSSWGGYYHGGGLISYYDATNGDLKFARKDSMNEWYPYVIDWAGNVGLYTYIYGNDPTYIVSYYGASDSTIRVGYYGEGGAVEENNMLSNILFEIKPNPFTSRVKICYSGARQLKIYDLSGRIVRQFTNLTSGTFNQINWDATDDKGNRVPAGVYFCRLGAGKEHKVVSTTGVAKLILMR